MRLLPAVPMTDFSLPHFHARNLRFTHIHRHVNIRLSTLVKLLASCWVYFLLRRD